MRRAGKLPPHLEQHLRELASFLKNAQDIVLFTLADGQIAEANDAATRAYGYRHTELLSMNVRQLYHPGAASSVDSQMTKAATKAFLFQTTNRRKDGTTFSVETSLQATKLDGELIFTHIVREIGGREPIDSDERFRLVVSHSPDIVCYQDRGLRYTWILNPSPPFTLEKTLGKTDNDLFSPEEAERLTEIKRGVLRSGVPAKTEFSSTSGPVRRYFEKTIEPRRNEEGYVIGLIGYSRDITERKQAEEQLAASEASYRAIFNAANDVILIHDIETGRILDANEKARDMYGYTPAEIRGLTVLALSAEEPPFTREKATRLTKEAAQGKPQLFEWKCRDKAGHVFWVEVNLQRACLNRQERLLAIVRDISERKRAEAERERLLIEVQSRAAEMDAIFASIPDGLMIFSPTGEIIRVNSTAQQILGYTPVQMKPTIEQRLELLRIETTDGRPLPYDELPPVRALRGETVLGVVGVIHPADGRTICVSASAAPIRTHDGTLLGAVQTLVDVTETRKAEAERERLLSEVQRRSAEMSGLLENLSEGVTIVDPEENIVLANPAAKRLWGIPQQEMPTSRWQHQIDFRYSDGRPMPYEEWPLTRALRGETFSDLAVIYRPDEDHRKDLSFSGSAVRDERGEVRLAILVFRDVTQLRRLEQLREEYVNTISHDLRAPLTVVKGHAQMLRQAMGKADVTGRELTNVNAIITAAQRMNTMIQDLVDSARMESGRLQLRCQPINLEQFIDDLLQRNTTSIDTGRVRVSSTKGLPPALADPDRLERILLNLLSNALKYSTPGTPVDLRLDRLDDQALVSVEDRGPGIAPEDLSHIFERYYRTKGEGKEGSVGMGLYITKMLVEAHSGRVHAESVLGRGSTFSFTLPLAM